MRNYERLLNRRSEQETLLFREHKGNESNKTYHAGYRLGYMSGQVNILQDAVEDISDLKARINQLEADIKLVIDNMETGFTVCDRCSNEQPVKNMDYKWMLEEALKGGDV